MARYDQVVLQKIKYMHKAFFELYGLIDSKHRIDISSSFNALTSKWSEIHSTAEPEDQVEEINKSKTPEDAFKARKELVLDYYFQIRRALIDAIHIINSQGVDASKLDGLNWINGLGNSDFEVIDALPIDHNPKYNLPGLLKSAIAKDGEKNTRYSGKWSRRNFPTLNIPEKEKTKATETTAPPKAPKPKRTRAAKKETPAKPKVGGETPTGKSPESHSAESPFRTATAAAGGGGAVPPPYEPPSGATGSTGASRGPRPQRAPGTSTPAGAALQKLLRDMEGRIGVKIDKLDTKLTKEIRLNGKKLDNLLRDFDPSRLRRPGTGDRSDSAKLDDILHLESEIIHYTKKTSQRLDGKDDTDKKTPKSAAGKRRASKENHMGFWKTIKEQALKDVGHFGRDVHNVLFPYLKMQESSLAGLLGKPHKDEKKDDEDRTKKIIEDTIVEWTKTKKYKECDCDGDESRTGRGRRRKTSSRMPLTIEGEVIRKLPNNQKRISHDIEAPLMLGHDKGLKALTYNPSSSLVATRREVVEGERAHEKYGELEVQKSIKERLDEIWAKMEKDESQKKMTSVLGTIWNFIKGAWGTISTALAGIGSFLKPIGTVLRAISKPIFGIAERLGLSLSADIGEALGVLSNASLAVGGAGVAIGAAVDASMAYAMDRSLKNQTQNLFDSFNKKNAGHVQQVGANAYQITDDAQYKGKTFKMAELPKEYYNAVNFDAPFPASPAKVAPVKVSAKPSSITTALKSVSQVQQTLDTEKASESGSPIVSPVVMPTPTPPMSSQLPDIGFGLDVNTTDTNETMQRHIGVLMNRTPGAANFR